MANVSKAKEQTTTTSATVDEKDTVAETSKNVVVDKVEKKDEAKTKRVKVEPLNDSDDIEVQSMIPNVSYLDTKNQDFYEWKNVGDIETMSYETLKNMWKNNRGYFKKLWIRPLDKRVIDKFNGLSKLYTEYDELMDVNTYNRDNPYYRR